MCPGPIMIGPAGRNMFRPGPAHKCAGQLSKFVADAGQLL
jgi:hypothetical protein